MLAIKGVIHLQVKESTTVTTKRKVVGKVSKHAVRIRLMLAIKGVSF